MRQGHRLDALERTLSPTGIILGWLETARNSETPTHYARELLDLPGAPHPLDQILDQVETALRGRHPGEERWHVDRMVWRAVGDAAFLFHLALRMDDAAGSFADRGELSRLLLQCQLGAAVEDEARASRRRRSRPLDDEHGRPGAAGVWARAALDLVDDMRVEREARTLLERAHYRGQSTLFRSSSRAWEDFEAACEVLDGMARAHLNSDQVPGNKPSGGGRHDDSAGLATSRAAEWVEEAQFVALRSLGRDDAARAIGIRRIRRLAVVSPG
jgi:hypothetical protein